jgi:cytidylate kinase
MAIVTLTQHLGTRCIELGCMSAERLEYRFLTADQLIAQTSKQYQVTPEQLAIVDERRPHFWERLKTDTQRFVAFFRAAVLKEMAKDRLVIVGRSVAQLLPDYRCGLRVRLVGPLKDRAREVALEEKLAPVVAARRVLDYDQEVRARIQTLLGVDIDDPANYTITLNTFALPLEVSAGMLADVASENRARCRTRPMAKGARRRNGRRGARRFDAPPEDRPRSSRGACASGAVQVNGPGLVPPWDVLVNDVARRVEGVKSVEVVAEEFPSAPIESSRYSQPELTRLDARSPKRDASVC